jgi:hypothetical protein
MDFKDKNRIFLKTVVSPTTKAKYLYLAKQEHAGTNRKKITLLKYEIIPPNE